MEEEIDKPIVVFTLRSYRNEGSLSYWLYFHSKKRAAEVFKAIGINQNYNIRDDLPQSLDIDTSEGYWFDYEDPRSLGVCARPGENCYNQGLVDGKPLVFEKDHNKDDNIPF